MNGINNLLSTYSSWSLFSFKDVNSSIYRSSPLSVYLLKLRTLFTIYNIYIHLPAVSNKHRIDKVWSAVFMKSHRFSVHRPTEFTFFPQSIHFFLARFVFLYINGSVSLFSLTSLKVLDFRKLDRPRNGRSSLHIFYLDLPIIDLVLPEVNG